MPTKRIALLIFLVTFSSLSPRLSACEADRLCSVHFNNVEPDFGTVPRRGRVRQISDRYAKESMGNGTPSGIELEVNPRDGSEWDANRARFIAKADALFRQGKWKAAQAAFLYVQRRFGSSGSVNDRLEIIQVLVGMRQKASPALMNALNEYALAVSAIPNESHPTDASIQAIERLANDKTIGFLQRHAMYQRACLAWDADRPEDAVLWFQRFLNVYRRGPRREEALIMLARAAVLSEDSSHVNVPICQTALDRLRREFPGSRFTRSAIGLRGRCLYLTRKFNKSLECYFAVGDMPSAEVVVREMQSNVPPDFSARLLAGYLRRLASAKNAYQYEQAVQSIDRVSKTFTPRDARLFSSMLTHDLTLPAPYFYFRLYHTHEYWKGLGQMARKADEILANHSAATLPALVRVRFAEIYYQQNWYPLALRWANMALDGSAASKPAWGEQPHESEIRGLYVRGATLHKMKRYGQALSDFESLASKHPDSPLIHGAREELALLYEATGDLSSALDQYFALGYQADIAYLLDARMRTDEIERYLRRCKGRFYTNAEDRWYSDRTTIPRTLGISDLITYSLGIRYLRAEKWDRAAYWLRQTPRNEYVNFSRGRYDWWNSKSPDPLTAARELGHLHRVSLTSATDNARATALFNYASYYYKHGNLLLYNPALWQHERESSFGTWNEKLGTKKDLQTIKAYMHEHEVYARTLTLCESIAARYPNSDVAPQALYRAAAAADRLSDFNFWWRYDDSHNHALEASKLMAKIVNRYPNSPLKKEAKKFAKIYKSEAAETKKWRAEAAKLQ
jgi:outer membrane protein assembly factor BamD (BamD/ComL family)